jgi:hypothetical protein
MISAVKTQHTKRNAEAGEENRSAAKYSDLLKSQAKGSGDDSWGDVP